VNERHQPRADSRWIVIACIALVLAATTAQVAHVCGFSPAASPIAHEAESGASGGPLCMICLMAQSIAGPVIFFATGHALRQLSNLRLLHANAHSFLKELDQYVRPPPAL
jgi:hypothetical protein